MWLYYWLASADINPFTDIRTVVVPPPQMVMNMRIGNMSGFCVGEPWNARAINDRIGFTAATSQAIWPDHPEKVLGTRREWVEKHPHTAGRWSAPYLRRRAGLTPARPTNVKRRKSLPGAPAQYQSTVPDRAHAGRIRQRCWPSLAGRAPDQFFRDGEVSFPWHSDGMWFLTQFRRWGLLKQAPDYADIAAVVNRIDIWRDAATAVGGITRQRSYCVPAR